MMKSNMSNGTLETLLVTDINKLPTTLIFNYGTMSISIIIIIIEATTMTLIWKCRRVPHRIIYMSISFLLSDLIAAMFYVAHQLAMFAFDKMNDLVYTSRVVMVSTMFAVSWASISTMSIERVIAIKMSLKYTAVMSDKRVTLILAFIWVFHILFVILAGVVGFEIVCRSNLEGCDIFAASTPVRLAMTCLLGFHEVLIIVCYGYIYKVALKHARSIDTVNRKNDGTNNLLTSQFIKTTNAILKIVLVFLILHTPFIIHVIIFEHYQSLRNNTLRRVFQAVCLICIQINSFVSVRLYIVTVKEVKMHLFYFLGKMSPRYLRKAETLRLDVYSIMTYSVNERQNAS